MQRLGEQVAGGRGVPRCFLPANPARPHEIQHWREADDDVDGPAAVHFVAHDRAGRVERHEQLFAHDEVRSDVNARDGFRAVLDASEHTASVDLRGSLLRPECDFERIDELQRVGPDLQAIL